MMEDTLAENLHFEIIPVGAVSMKDRSVFSLKVCIYNPGKLGNLRECWH